MKEKIMRIFSILVVALMLSGCAIGLGTNTDLVGPETNHRQIMVDGQLIGQNHLTDRLYFERAETIFIIGSNDATRAGLGIKGGLRYYLSDRFSAYASGGAAVIPDGGDLEKLAHSWLYGTIDFGLQYRNMSMGLTHISSPFHTAEDGDSGINMFMLRWEF